MAINRMIVLILGIAILISGLFKFKIILGFFAKFNILYDCFGVNGVRITAIIVGIALVLYAIH